MFESSVGACKFKFSETLTLDLGLGNFLLVDKINSITIQADNET